MFSGAGAGASVVVSSVVLCSAVGSVEVSVVGEALVVVDSVAELVVDVLELVEEDVEVSSWSAALPHAATARTGREARTKRVLRDFMKEDSFLEETGGFLQ